MNKDSSVQAQIGSFILNFYEHASDSFPLSVRRVWPYATRFECRFRVGEKMLCEGVELPDGQLAAANFDVGGHQGARMGARVAHASKGGR